MTNLAEESARGGASLFLGVGMATVAAGIGSILIGRLLGPGDYALYSLALVFPTLLFSFSIFGIDISLVRYIPKLRAEGRLDEANSVLRTGLLLRAISGSAMAVVGIIGSDLFAALVLNRPTLAPLIRFSCIAVAFEALFWVTFYIFQGLDKIAWSGANRSFQALLKTCVSVGLILLGFGLFGAIAGFVASYVLTAVLSVVLLFLELRKGESRDFHRFSKKVHARMLLSFGLPLCIVTIIASLAIQYRLVVLAAFASDIEVGNFSAAVNIATLLAGISTPLIISLLPVFSKVSSTGTQAEIEKAFTMAHRYVALLVVPSTILFIVLSKEIVLFLYGPEYGLAALYLMQFASIFLLVGLGNGVLESFFNGIGKNMLTLAFWTIYLALFLPLGFFLTQEAGVTGLVAAEFISRACACVYGLWVGKRRLHMTMDIRGIVQVFLSAGVAGGFLLILKLVVQINELFVLLIGTALFFFLYLTLVPLTGALRESDIDLLDRAFSPMRGISKIATPLLKYERFVLSRTSRE